MLNKLRNFSKGKLAGLLVAIIIVPFVFWGMGSVFSGGNKNILVEINNENISIQDFIEHINKSQISTNDIKNNLDKNIIEEILTQVISLKLMEMEIKDIDISLSDQALKKIIINDSKFFDDKKKFSRIKYEKFLIENNTSASELERKIKESKLQENLFKYVSGGIKSPDFYTKNLFLEETKKIKIQFINLENIYKKNFSNDEINKFINENTNELKREYLDIDYIKITPQDLTNSKEFNSDFFKILDEIENDISNGIKLTNISKNYNLSVNSKNNFFKSSEENDEKFFETIFNNRNIQKIGLIDKEDYYIIYEIKQLRKELPKIDDKIFIKEVLNRLKSIEKFKYNKKILKKIETDNFKSKDFFEIAGSNEKIEDLIIKSKNDNSFFNVDSLKLIYTIPENDYLLIVDNDKNVYLTKVVSFDFNTIDKNSDEFNKYFVRSNFRIKNDLTTSYDLLLNEKYDVKVNKNTLENVKNYFK